MNLHAARIQLEHAVSSYVVGDNRVLGVRETRDQAGALRRLKFRSQTLAQFAHKFVHALLQG
jgi:hypothetical protein